MHVGGLRIDESRADHYLGGRRLRSPRRGLSHLHHKQGGLWRNHRSLACRSRPFASALAHSADVTALGRRASQRSCRCAGGESTVKTTRASSARSRRLHDRAKGFTTARFREIAMASLVGKVANGLVMAHAAFHPLADGRETGRAVSRGSCSHGARRMSDAATVPVTTATTRCRNMAAELLR